MLKIQENVAPNENIQRERNFGIDLLRVIATFMVVLLHVLSQGGILKALGNFTVKGEIMWVVQITCFCAVNVFGLISGYVGIGAKHKLSNLLSLWIQVVLYNGISVVLINMLRLDSFSIKNLLKAIFPVISSENWYFSAYFALFFFMPILDELIEKMKKKDLRMRLFVVVVFFTLFETIKSVDVFGIRAGYSVLWLVLMYLIGAYIKKYDPLKHLSSISCIWGFWGCVLLTFLSRLMIELVTWRFTGVPSHGTKFITYTSPLMVLQAIFILELFSKMRVQKSIATVASWLAPMTFGVYIIHTTTVVYRYILRDAFVFVADYSLLGTLGLSVLIAIGVYLLCSILDWIRIFLFKIFKVNNLTVSFGRAIEKIIIKL